MRIEYGVASGPVRIDRIGVTGSIPVIPPTRRTLPSTDDPQPTSDVDVLQAGNLLVGILVFLSLPKAERRPLLEAFRQVPDSVGEKMRPAEAVDQLQGALTAAEKIESGIRHPNHQGA